MRILVTDGMDKNSVEQLRSAGFEIVEEYYEPEILKDKLKEFDGVVIRSATKIRKPIIDGALQTKRLKLIIRAGVGVDNIDVNYAMEHGIQVMNTPNASSASVAELVIAHMFAISRHIHISNVAMRNGEWNKDKYKGIELAGKTLGLIGFGRIATETARIASAIGMKIIYTDIAGKKEGYDQYTFVSMEELLENAHFISLHIPFNKENGAVIGSNEFKQMKDGVYVINAARGGVVDEKALVDALNAGKVAAAAVDVFEEEPTKNEALYTHPKVSVTPHIGASTKEAQARIGLEVVDVLTKFFK